MAERWQVQSCPRLDSSKIYFVPSVATSMCQPLTAVRSALFEAPNPPPCIAQPPSSSPDIKRFDTHNAFAPDVVQRHVHTIKCLII